MGTTGEPGGARRRPCPVSRVLVVCALLGLLLATAACGPAPWAGPQPSPARSPGEDYEFIPQESDVVFTPQPDGTVRVRQTLIVDAGPGLDGAIRLYLKRDLRIQLESGGPLYSLRPSFAGPSATSDRAPAAVNVESDDSGHRLTLRGSWSPGRHKVVLDYLLTGVWASAGGTPVVVLPPAAAQASWYSSNRRGDVTRFRIADGRPLRCYPARSQEQCVPGDPVARYLGQVDNGSTTSGRVEPGYLLTDPPAMTAPAPPAQEVGS